MLQPEQEKYIRDHSPKHSARKIARDLKVDVPLVQGFIGRLDAAQRRTREKVFRVVVLSVAPLFFLLLELGLRVVNYGGTTDLFVKREWKGKAYYQINPNVARRYFSRSELAPYISEDRFAVEKAPNSYRIFCLGASTTVGYPYLHNASFSSLLNDRLSVLFPEKTIEMVNAGMTAVNSFTVADFAKEIMNYDPDLLMIYTGHNEFYGALGIGSTEYGGRSRRAVQLYLVLQRVKVARLVRDGLRLVHSAIHGSKEPQPGTTLMQTMARDKHIRYHSEEYQIAKDHFRSNLLEVIRSAEEKQVAVLLGTLVSNLRDQPPFVSLHSDSTSPEVQRQWEKYFEQGLSYEEQEQLQAAAEYFSKAIQLDSNRADAHFHLARCYDRLGDPVRALREYRSAKDLDALRFRASEEFNDVIRALGQENGIPVVEMESALAQHSPDGILGAELFWEHVHPKFAGYFWMAKEFCRAMADNSCMAPKEQWNWQFDKSDEEYEQLSGVTDFDLEVGKLRIGVLKSGWPFRAQAVPFRYEPQTQIQHAAWDYANQRIEWGAAHLRLAKEFVKEKQLDLAEKEYRALAKALRDDTEMLLWVGDLQVQQKKYAEAFETFDRALRASETPLVQARIGSLYLVTNQNDKAIEHLQRALILEADGASKLTPHQRFRVIYLLGRAYVNALNAQEAQKQVERLREIFPKAPVIGSLERQIARLRSAS